MNKTNEIQEHRGADSGFRNKPENITRQCEQITHMRYGWTGDGKAMSCTPSKKLWTMHKTLKKKFLTVNYRFKSDGTKIQVI
jgi:hypothetical protein